MRDLAEDRGELGLGAGALGALMPMYLALCGAGHIRGCGPTMAKLYGRLNRTEPPRGHRLIIAALKAGDEPGLRLAIRTDVTQGLRMLLA